MNRGRTSGGITGGRSRLAAGIAGAALLVAAVPSSGLAFGLLDDSSSHRSSDSSLAAFTPAAADPRVARIVAERSEGQARFMRFTPAGSPDNGSRAVTVAVRVDQETAQAISVRSAIDAASDARVAGDSGLRIAPTRYNLGLARGYQSFAKAPVLSGTLSDAGIPDLTEFEPSAGVKDEPSRFAARVQMEEGEVAAQSQRMVRQSGQSAGDQTLDVAGSYRLTRNLDVTAGVRYSTERGRIAPLRDVEEQDSQAVYIGTQFRF